MYRIPYMTEPPWAKHGQRLALLLRYLSIILLGIFCLFYSIQWVPLVGLVLITTGLAASIGVITGYYRFEWISIGPMTAALLVAAILVWPFSAGIVEALIFALAFTQVDRLIHLTAISVALRRQHKAAKYSTAN